MSKVKDMHMDILDREDEWMEITSPFADEFTHQIPDKEDYYSNPITGGRS
jgi:hypothetical protein